MISITKSVWTEVEVDFDAEELVEDLTAEEKSQLLVKLGGGQVPPAQLAEAAYYELAAGQIGQSTRELIYQIAGRIL